MMRVYASHVLWVTMSLLIPYLSMFNDNVHYFAASEILRKGSTLLIAKTT